MLTNRVTRSGLTKVLMTNTNTGKKRGKTTRKEDNQLTTVLEIFELRRWKYCKNYNNAVRIFEAEPKKHYSYKKKRVFD